MGLKYFPTGAGLISLLKEGSSKKKKKELMKQNRKHAPNFLKHATGMKQIERVYIHLHSVPTFWKRGCKNQQGKASHLVICLQMVQNPEKWHKVQK